MNAAPDVQDIANYLSSTGMTSWTDEEIGGALAAEAASQGRACVLPADGDEWPADLAEALRRRVARNLALRKLPLGLLAGEVSTTRISGTDPEIRRLESPWRRWTVA